MSESPDTYRQSDDAAAASAPGAEDLHTDPAEPEETPSAPVPDEPSDESPSATGSGESATRVLPPTGLASFADECELATIALQDFRESELALLSLTQVSPATTAMLTEATRSGNTQALPASLRNASVLQLEAEGGGGKASAPAEETGERDSSKKRHISRRTVAIVTVLIVALVAAGVFAASWFAETFLGEPGISDVTAVLTATSDIMDGFASNDYVDESTYELTDVAITGSVAGEDGAYTVDATATLANQSFSSALTCTLRLVRSANASLLPEGVDTVETPDGWVGYVVSSSATTRAIAGVTHDPDYPDGFAPTFDEAAQTCSFTSEDSYDLWFGSDLLATQVTYTFDGTSWVRTVGEATPSVTFAADAIEGAYAPASEGTSSFTMFRISHVDAAAGTFSIEYSAAAPGFGSAAVSGIIECTIAQTEPTEATRSYRQLDGYVYTLTGEGTSSGGDGSASLQGTLGVDGMLVVSCSIDYTRAPFLFGQPTNESMEVAGTLSRSMG